mgnify:CR=1 FL=1
MVRVLFLGGLGRSGTTLLERILGQLPGVCPLGEVVHLWQRDIRDDERCSCGARFSACDFWQGIGQRAFGGWEQVDTNRVCELRTAVERTRHLPRLAGRRLPTAYESLVREYTSYYTRIYRAAAEQTGARVIIDSSKHASLAYCLRWAQDIDLRIVHVVRDSRGVAYSWTKQVSRPEADGALMTRYTPTRSALLWNTHNAAFDLLGRWHDRLVRVRYEDFLLDPVATIKELAEFAEIDPGPMAFLTASYVDLRPGHSAAGNPIRFTVGRVPIIRDDAWRTELPAGQRRLVTTLTAPMLRRYGYQGTTS